MCFSVLDGQPPLLVRLQSPNQDFLQALESVRDAVRVLQSLRDDTDKFHELYTAVEEAVGEVPMPRWAKVTNPTVRCARQYYRVSVYVAFIDTCLGQLRERFESHLARGARLSALLPAVCTRSSCSFEQLRPAVIMYSRLLDSSCDQVRSELCCSSPVREIKMYALRTYRRCFINHTSDLSSISDKSKKKT